MVTFNGPLNPVAPHIIFLVQLLILVYADVPLIVILPPVVPSVVTVIGTFIFGRRKGHQGHAA